MRVVEQAPAKVNLFLGVEPRIVSGKHLLTSVFTTISVYDTLTFDIEQGPALDSDAVTLDMTAAARVVLPDISADDNVVLQAVRAFISKFGHESVPAQKFHITLEKRIPAQAGMGGGSSDAAATLKVLARLSGMEQTAPELLEVARKLGADIPFFLFGGCVLMDGFGDSFVERLTLPQTDLVLAKPACGVSASEVYRAFDELAPAVPDSAVLLAALRGGAEKAALCEGMENNLEPVLRKMLVEIANIERLLAACPRVIRTMLSGSGTVVFGVCEDIQAAQLAAGSMRGQGYWACAARTVQEELTGAY